MTRPATEHMTIANMREYAEQHDIPLTGLTTKDDIAQQIQRTYDARRAAEDAVDADAVAAMRTDETPAAPSTYPAVVERVLEQVGIDADTVEFWRLEGNVLAVGHYRNGTLVGSRPTLTDDEVAELVDLDVTRGGRA